jgi:hypothetical protein
VARTVTTTILIIIDKVVLEVFHFKITEARLVVDHK